MLPIRCMRGAPIEHDGFDLSAAQPPDLEPRTLGAECLGDRAAVELALPGIALAARAHIGTRVLPVGLVIDDHEPPGFVAVEEIDASRDEPEWARVAFCGRRKQHGELACDHVAREV